MTRVALAGLTLVAQAACIVIVAAAVAALAGATIGVMLHLENRRRRHAQATRP
jgi:hypothetical protein